MRRWTLAIAALSLSLLLIGSGFVAGRILAPAPRYQTDPEAVESLESSWQAFISSQQQTLELFRNSTFFAGEQAEAEAYRGLLYSLVGAIQGSALMRPDQPRFRRAVDWSSKSGLDNPDNNYYTAVLRDDMDYRITGCRGNAAELTIQLLKGRPGVKDAGTSTQISILHGEELRMDEQGQFEIIISRQKPERDGNWMANGEGAQTLVVRFTHNRWDEERAGQLRIERLGGEGEPAPPLSRADMSRALQDAAVTLFDSNATWLRYARLAWRTMPRNGVSQARPSQGGLTGQYSAFGTWELDEDQALVLRVARSPATYQGIELGNLWFVSLDYESRTSSLNFDQLKCNDPSRCHVVISHRDPGIHNWLDTEGHPRGLIMMRWQGLKEALTEEQQPRAMLVPLASLEENLPADVVRITPEQRWQQIRSRRASVQDREGHSCSLPSLPATPET